VWTLPEKTGGHNKTKGTVISGDLWASGSRNNGEKKSKKDAKKKMALWETGDRNPSENREGSVKKNFLCSGIKSPWEEIIADAGTGQSKGKERGERPQSANQEKRI